MNKKTMIILGAVVILAIVLFVIFGTNVLKGDTESPGHNQTETGGQQEISLGSDTDPIQPIEFGVETASEELIGLWQSLDREGYTVRINTDGSYLEDLENVASTAATWRVLDSLSQEEVGANGNTEGIFLEQAFSDGATFYYRLLELSSERLIMMYLENGNGGVLGFERAE